MTLGHETDLARETPKAKLGFTDSTLYINRCVKYGNIELENLIKHLVYNYNTTGRIEILYIMFTVQLFLYFPLDWKTGNEQIDGAITAACQTASGRETITITLEDMWESLNNLGICDSRLRLMVESSPPGAIVKVLQSCRMLERPEKPLLSSDLERQNVDAIASTQKTIKSLEITEKEVTKRISTKLREERDLHERLQFLIGRIADIQQKLDESSWDAAEPERGIREAEEDLFALED